jgi:hypothetical protein
LRDDKRRTAFEDESPGNQFLQGLRQIGIDVVVPTHAFSPVGMPGRKPGMLKRAEHKAASVTMMEVSTANDVALTRGSSRERMLC